MEASFAQGVIGCLLVIVRAVYGALLGSQKGRSVEICNSFELVVSDERQLDREYFTAKEEQCTSWPILKRAGPLIIVQGSLSIACPFHKSLSCTYLVKQVFSTMEFLGWYTIGGAPTKEDVRFHEQVQNNS